MRDPQDFQIHANVNGHGKDHALRLSVTTYGSDGHADGHHTWRRHVSGLWMESLAWIGYSGAVDLAKMMADVCGTEVDVDEPEVPLFDWPQA